MLTELKNVPAEKRTAVFRCVIAVYHPETGSVRTVEGRVQGRIIAELRGENGFGYDPIFFLPSMNKTLAELTIEEKNKVSHRALALEKAREIIAELAGQVSVK